MARKRNKARVPAVLWRLFHNRARTLSDTIVSLLPSPPPSPDLCLCHGGRCIGCSRDARSFLLRPDDPSDYRKLLSNCYVVVSENAPSIPVFIPHSLLPQSQIVKSIIELMPHGRESANVLCSGYDRRKGTSPILELLSGASWCLLLSRVGDDLMVYLLKNTSIFLATLHGKHHQVVGPSISCLCFDMLKSSAKFGYQHPSHHKFGAKKRKRADVVDLTVEKPECNISSSTNDPLGFSSSLGLTCKSSVRNITDNGCRNYDSISEVHESTKKGTAVRKLNSEGNQGLKCITPKLAKRSRPFSWQRRSCKKQKQLAFGENSLHTNSNLLPTNTDGLHSSFEHDYASLSNHAKGLLQCSCCLTLQSVPTVPKRTDIKRQSIFYNLDSSCSVLPKKHILYSLRPNLASSKYLVDNIFGFSDVTASAQPMPCLHNSGSCLINSECLYHFFLKWFKHLIRRTRCCKHTELLNKHCVVPSLDEHMIGRSSSRLKDNASETNVPKESHKFGTKHCADTAEAKDSLCKEVKSYCSKSQVVSFIWAVSRSLLPSELLGTPSNWRVMRRNIFKFICLRRYEKFPLRLCMHELKTSRFPFLSDEYFLNGRHARVLRYIEQQNEVLNKEFRNDAVFAVKTKLLEKWIFWYFSYLVVPLVQANFYVTESEQGKQDIYYYPRPVWKKLTDSTIACFKDWRYSYLDDVAVYNILQRRPFGFSKLRLQPKENGVRMVANLKGSSRFPLPVSTTGVQFSKTEREVKPQKVKFEKYKSVNYVLSDAHSILKGILLKYPEKLGSSVFDYNGVYKKLCPFLVGLKKGSASMPNLFILTSDVLKAFDSVDQDKLLGVMKDVLLKDEYFLKRCDQVVCTKKSLWVQRQFTMLDETSNIVHTPLTSFASFHTRHAVFVNQEEWKRVKRKELFSYLMEHVKHNVLLFDGKFFLQGVGIPQGGVLSSLLCSIYYGQLERQTIFPFLEKALETGRSKENNNAVHSNCGDKVQSPCYMLMRFIDDFLFISTSKKQAASFFSRLQRGFRDFNCYMNERKFGANFDVEPGFQLNRVNLGVGGTTSFLRWSGLLINCSTMEIQADYMRYLNNHLSSTLTVSWQGKPGIHLKEKLRLFLRPKCHPIFFDSNINSAGVIRLNIYQVFLLCAMKFHCYIRDLSFICKLNTRYCSDIILGSLRYMYQLIKKRMNSARHNLDMQPILKLEKEEVEWLGIHAFIQVLKRKQSRHKELLGVLRSRMLSHRMFGRVSPELKYAVDTKNSSLLWDIKY